MTKRTLDLDNIIQDYDTVTVKGTEYKVGSIQTKTLLAIQKLVQDAEGKSDVEKSSLLTDQIHIILSQDNEITKKEIESWGLQAHIEFLKWFNEPFLAITQTKKEQEPESQQQSKT